MFRGNGRFQNTTLDHTKTRDDEQSAAYFLQMNVILEKIKRTDPRILADMAIHYSQPKGFVGRNICYAVLFEGNYYGSIVGGSATLHLAGRDEFFPGVGLNQIVNNIFFHCFPSENGYPFRNFVQKVLGQFRQQIVIDWEQKYSDQVLGLETLVELPRTGECYRRDGWTLVGQTKGFTCKRIAGKGTDSWSGKRVWDTKNLRPKLVFVRKP